MCIAYVTERQSNGKFYQKTFIINSTSVEEARMFLKEYANERKMEINILSILSPKGTPKVIELKGETVR